MKPTIEEAIAALYKIIQVPDMQYVPQCYCDTIEAFLTKEQEAEIPSEYLVSVSKLQADLELAKEGLRLAKEFAGYQDTGGYTDKSYLQYRDICKRLGVE